ncbi:MAG TPA: UDP-N-acetylmuramoyl-tripeptide--D-alanyl-D-alanine ligase [candidate division Zixibacteria bacterium]
MFEIKLNELKRVVDGETPESSLKGDQLLRGISIDSRKVDPNNIFVAIPGEKFDGHSFIGDAVSKGAKAVVIDREKKNIVPPEVYGKTTVILVSDTKKALRDVAFWYRSKFNLPVVAVTGTNGKTTTKDMIAQVLSSKFQVLKSPESYNNLIGVPLTLFQLNPGYEALVLELGMSSPGEISILTKIVQPQIGVITNIGPAHLESMQSMERIAKAKFELPDNMPSPKTLVLNADDRILAKRIARTQPEEKVVSFGVKKKADFIADRIEANGNGYISFRVNKNTQVKLSLLGWHNVYNALVAFSVGYLLGVEESKIKERLESFSPSRLRMELVTIDNVRIINDSYNANPVSMEKALETLKNMKTFGRKIAVLGDMLELGEGEMDFHLELGRKAAKSGVNLLITIGELGRFIGEGAREAGWSDSDVINFENNQEASLYLLENLKEGDLVLVKGSRKMRTEEIVFSLKSQYGRQN